MDAILERPFTDLRIELSEKFREGKFSQKDFEQFTAALKEEVKKTGAGDIDLLEAEIEKVQKALVKGVSPTIPNVSQPVNQLLWGAALVVMQTDPTVTQDWSPSVMGDRISKSKIWSQLVDTPTVKSELIDGILQMLLDHKVIDPNKKKDRETRVRWGEPLQEMGGYPGVGYYFYREAQPNPIINLDLLWGLISGLEHARSATLHEIAHSQGTIKFTPKMQEIREEMEAIQKKPIRTPETHKRMAVLAQQWQLRHLIFDEAENSFANRYTVNQSAQSSQDYGAALNNIETTLAGAGMQVLNSRNGKGDKTAKPDPMKKLQNLKSAIRYSFYKNNELFEDTPKAWLEMGVNPEWISALPKEAGGEVVSGAAAFAELMEYGKRLEELQPKPRDRIFGAEYYSKKMEEYNEQRNEVIEEIFDRYVEPIVREVEKQTEQDMDQQMQDQASGGGKSDGQQQDQNQQQDGSGEGDSESNDKNDDQKKSGNDQGKGKGQGQSKDQNGQGEENNPEKSSGDGQSGDEQEKDEQQEGKGKGESNNQDAGSQKKQDKGAGEGDQQGNESEQKESGNSGGQEQGDEQGQQQSSGGGDKDEDGQEQGAAQSQGAQGDGQPSDEQGEGQGSGQSQSQGGYGNQQGGESAPSTVYVEGVGEMADFEIPPDTPIEARGISKKDLLDQDMEQSDYREPGEKTIQELLDDNREPKERVQSGPALRDYGTKVTSKPQQGVRPPEGSFDYKARFAVGEITPYSKHADTLYPSITNIAIIFKRIREKQQKKVTISTPRSLLTPEEGIGDIDNLASGVRELREKQLTGQSITHKDRLLFPKSSTKNVPPKPRLVILVDHSGSTYHRVGNSRAIRLEVARDALIMANEGAKMAGWDTSIYAIGGSEPITLSSPKDRAPDQAGRNITGTIMELIDGIHDGSRIGCGNEGCAQCRVPQEKLAPGIKQATKDLAEEVTNPNAAAADTMILVISDGEINDMNAAKEAIRKLNKSTDKVTIDTVIINDHSTPLSEFAEKARGKSRKQTIGIANPRDTDQVEQELATLLSDRLRKVSNDKPMTIGKTQRNLKQALRGM